MQSAIRNPHQQRHYKALSKTLYVASDQIRGYLEGLSDAQLRQAHILVKNLGTGNCAALMYWGKRIFQETMRDESYRRQAAAKGKP